MSTHDHDNDTLPGEDELKALYRSLPRKEPSPEMDRAVKRAASDAVRPAHRRTVTRWPVAVASVAMVVVAAGLGWRMLQRPSSVPQISSTSSVSAASAPALPPAPAAAPAAAPQPALAPAHPIPVEPTAPAPSTASRKAAPPLLSERENIRSTMKPKLAERAVAPAPPPAPAVMEAATPVMPAPEATANAAYAPQPAPAPASPAPPAPLAQMSVAPAEAPAPTLPSPASSAATMGGLSYHAAPMRAAAAPAPMPEQDATAFDPADTPEQELAKIRQLFALHRHDEGMQRLLSFRQAHPGVPLPDDLRARLPDHE